MESRKVFMLVTVLVASLSMCCCDGPDESDDPINYQGDKYDCAEAQSKLAGQVSPKEISDLIAETRDRANCMVDGISLNQFYRLRSVKPSECTKIYKERRQVLCTKTKNQSLKNYCEACVEMADEYCQSLPYDQLMEHTYWNQFGGSDFEDLFEMNGYISDYINSNHEEMAPLAEAIKNFCLQESPTPEWAVTYAKTNCKYFEQGVDDLKEFEPSEEKVIKYIGEQVKQDMTELHERCKVVRATPECQRESV